MAKKKTAAPMPTRADLTKQFDARLDDLIDDAAKALNDAEFLNFLEEGEDRFHMSREARREELGKD